MSARLTTGSVRNEAALLARVVARDQSALGELYDMYSRLLFGLILRILKNRDEAEEVLQEVFVQAWMRADTYQPSSGSPAGWLVGIARNRAIDRLRANNVRARALDAPALPAAQESPESQASFAEQQLAVYRALDALPPEQRDLIEQAYFLGFTHSELAARCSLPLGTVKTRIRDGMRALRDRLEATVDG
ncbi:MAG TPA: sigma-70 family RNA polymerase sigma factor [Vicinamibacterales bacterium]